MTTFEVSHSHHEESPGDVYIEIGSWNSIEGITVFARDAYTHCTSSTVVPWEGDYEVNFAKAVEAVTKSMFRTLQNATQYDIALGHTMPEVTTTEEI